MDLGPRISPSEVVQLYNERSKFAGVEQQILREITNLYQGDIVVPLPELGANEAPAVPNIARAGIDQIGQRIASGFPEISVRPSSMSRRSVARSRERRRAYYSFHEENKTKRKMRRRARYLMGYASAPVRLGVNFETSMPRWDVRSPVGMYAAPSGDPDEMIPSDVIFATRQSVGWVRKHYPEQYVQLVRGQDVNAGTPVDVLEYISAHDVWTVVCLRSSNDGSQWDFMNMPQDVHRAGSHAALSWYPNRVGVPLVVVPGAITLGPQRSPYHQIKGMYQASAEMDAWARHATAKGINAETWFIGINGQTPVIEQAADALNSIPGIVTDGQMQTVTPPPQFAARTAVGDMERSSRLTAQLPAELGGEAATGVRTGRRSDQLLSAVLDFPIQEAHELFEESIEYENEIAARIDFEYFGDVPKVFSVNFAGEKGDLAYVPRDLWTKGGDGKTLAVKSKVSYFAAGVDAQDRIIAMGQRLGMGTMSQETVMRNDPLVDDVEGERSRIVNEELDRAFLSKIQGLAADPASVVTAMDLASLKSHVNKGLPLEEAWGKVQAEIEKRVAAEQEAAAQGQAMPGPGVVEPGGAPVGPAIGAPPESVGNLNSLLAGLRSQQVFATPQG